MSLWLFALGILALLLEPRPSCSITHSAQVDPYVKKLIVEFKTDPQSRRCDNRKLKHQAFLSHERQPEVQSCVLYLLGMSCRP